MPSATEKMVDGNNAETIEARFTKYDSERNGVLRRARDCAELTSPALMPPDNFSENDELPVPVDNIGARGVGNVSNKLLMTLFPPNMPFFKYAMDESIIQIIEAEDAEAGNPEGAGYRAEIEERLADQEAITQADFESGMFRPKLQTGLKSTLVTGNYLFNLPEEANTLKGFRLDNYVIKRDGVGNILEIITREYINLLALDEDTREQIIQNSMTDQTDPASIVKQDDYILYTQVLRTDEDTYEVSQEINGILLDKKETYKPEELPWIPVRWSVIDGEDYGRGLSEECLGDLRQFMGYAQALANLTAAASKIVFLVDQTAQTSIKALNKARSGDFVKGNKQDITVFQLDKFYDAQMVREQYEAKKRDLEFSFLLNSAIQRKGERVTAEEVRYMAQELEDRLGGVYSTLSQELQLPLIRVLHARLVKKGKLVKLPDNSIRPVITAGLEALGRGFDYDRLALFVRTLKETIGEYAFEQLNKNDLVKRLGVSIGINMRGLILTPQQIQQQKEAMMQAQQQQQIQQIIGNAAPGMLTKAMDNPEMMNAVAQQTQT